MHAVQCPLDTRSCSGAGGSGPEVCRVSAREPVTEPCSRMLEMEIVELNLT